MVGLVGRVVGLGELGGGVVGLVGRVVGLGELGGGVLGLGGGVVGLGELGGGVVGLVGRVVGLVGREDDGTVIISGVVVSPIVTAEKKKE